MHPEQQMQNPQAQVASSSYIETASASPCCQVMTARQAHTSQASQAQSDPLEFAALTSAGHSQLGAGQCLTHCHADCRLPLPPGEAWPPREDQRYCHQPLLLTACLPPACWPHWCRCWNVCGRTGVERQALQAALACTHIQLPVVRWKGKRQSKNGCCPKLERRCKSGEARLHSGPVIHTAMRALIQSCTDKGERDWCLVIGCIRKPFMS